MAINSFDIPAQFVEDVVISKAAESSAVAASTNYAATSSKDLAFVTYNAEPAIHDALSGTPKVATATGTADVLMNTVYTAVEFVDWEAEAAPRVVAQVESKMPGVLAKALDRIVLGPTLGIANSKFVGFTNSAVVDGTAATWDAAITSILDEGYDPNLIVVNKRFRSLFQAAYSDGVIGANALNVRGTDGIQIGGATVYFRDLGPLATTVVGYIGDFSQAAAAFSTAIEVNEFSHKTDYTLGLSDRDAAIALGRIGFNVADQDAFVRLAAV